jgi:hypothetical protein
MFGEPIPYEKKNAEISTLIATRERFPLPQLWNCVYDVDPNMLLKRGYDRIVIVERDLEELLRVYQIYFHEDMSWKQQNTVIRKTKEQWELVYNSGIDDLRVMQVKLSDLSNYTKETFTELMDFLNFPKVGRPPIIPTPVPNRNWEAFSSLLTKDSGICDKLQGIEDIYRRNLNRKIPSLEKLLIIGPTKDVGCHFSENIFDVAKEQIDVTYTSPYELAPINTVDLKLYKGRKHLYPLSKVLKKVGFDYDLIIVDECIFSWLDDVNIPVFYQHREFKRPPTVFYPDIAFFWHKGIINYYSKMFAPHWANRVNMMPLHIAVNPELYKPQEKTIKGLVGIGGRESLEEVIGYMKELTNISTLELQRQEQIEFIDMGFNWFKSPITDGAYRVLLPKCEMIWIALANRQYVSRRMLDAMACKTLCLIKIENTEHERILYDMGFKANIHYVLFNKINDLRNLDIHPADIQRITENAYNVVFENHTYEKRFEQIKELYMSYMEKKTGDVYDYG